MIIHSAINSMFICMYSILHMYSVQCMLHCVEVYLYIYTYIYYIPTYSMYEISRFQAANLGQ